VARAVDKEARAFGGGGVEGGGRTMHCRTAAALFLHAEEKQLFSLTAGEPPHCVDAICEPPGAVTTQRGILLRAGKMGEGRGSRKKIFLCLAQND
jgi:hypothetical protein